MRSATSQTWKAIGEVKRKNIRSMRKFAQYSGKVGLWALITNPAGKAKAVVLTEQGLPESQRLFESLFTG